MLADLRGSNLFVAEGEHRRARIGIEAANLGEFGDDIFGDAVAKIFVFLGGAEVFEIEYRYRFRDRFADARLCFAQFRGTLGSGVEIALEAIEIGLSSVAVWQRMARSFSRSFERMRPKSGGTAGFTSAIGRGSRFKMASKNDRGGFSP